MKEKTIKSYKGFDNNLQCRGFQYEVGKEYELDGNIKVCERGFHACESPLEVLDYYQIFGNDLKNNRFCVVEQCGTIDKDEKSTKICSSKIKIKAELKLSDLINLGVEWVKEQVKYSGKKTDLSDKGGDYAQIGSSGYSAQIGSSGYFAKIGSSGDYAKIESSGEDSVICCSGDNSIAKAKKGSWITLSEWVYSKEKLRSVPKCVKTEYVDGERIKPDTWYKLVDGEFKEANK